LEFLPRLSDYLGGPRILVKRDDQTGLALGGNKARKLEFLVAEALAQGCDTLVTTGGPQSNHARQTAAAAAKVGLRCELVLPRIVPWSTPEYERSGNVLLDRLLGAGLHCPPAEEFSSHSIDEVLAALVAQGRRPYFIPTGGSSPLGALGYVHAVDELLDQAQHQQITIHTIVVPTGSAGTHAGILAGLIHAEHPANVQGFAVSATAREKEPLVATLTQQVLELVGRARQAVGERVHVDDRFVGPGYGLPFDAMIEAVRLVARLEGLLLDPVYTGKAMAGLIDLVRQGCFASTDHVIFWHTGGTPALFAYERIF
jgi:L-cysteate sulfo-lyase